jgi:serine/threonine protein kinase
MGIVYMVYSAELDKRFAAKTFKDEYLWNYDAIERFRREGKTWISLDMHPHIVQACFIKNVDNKPYIFLEYVDGLSLAEKLNQGPLHLTDALDVSLQFCGGMAYAFEKACIIHRDVKPANVMLTSEGLAKVTDFGLAKGLSLAFADKVHPGLLGQTCPDSALTQEGQVMGTPLYMAPEQWAGAQNVDTRADIYSFGIMLYEMLVGKPPFELERNTPMRILYERHVKGISPALNEQGEKIPGSIRSALLKSTATEPSQRFQDFRELSRTIQGIYHSLIGRAWTPPRGPTPPQVPSASGLMLKAMSLASLDDHQAAISEFDKALEIEPGNVMAFQMKAKSCCALGNYPEALRLFRKAEAVDPDDPDLQDNLAYCLNGLKRYEEALRYADRSVELDPHCFSSWNNRAISLNSLGRYEDAGVSLKRALELDRFCPEAWNNYGFLLRHRGKLNEAESCYQRAIQINPRYIQPYFNLSEMMYSRNLGKEALSVIDQLLVIDPDNMKAKQIRKLLISNIA